MTGDWTRRSLPQSFIFCEDRADVNRTAALLSVYLVRNMMLTTSVAAASMSDSFSYKLMHITPTKGVNRHSPVAGFIIAHRFVTGKHKTEQMIACSVFVCDAKSEVVRSIRSCSIYSCRYADNGLATFSYVAGGGAPAERDAGTGAGASRDVPICFEVRGHCARKLLITVLP